MDINLSGIIKNEGGIVAFSDRINICDMQSMGSEIRFLQPVAVSGKVQNIGSVLEMNGTVSGVLTTNCSRCNREISCEFAADIKEILMQEDGRSSSDDEGLQDDEDIVMFRGHSLSIDEIAENSIYLRLELRYLCSDDCKGICSVCGKDNNAEACACADNKIDPRFAALSKLNIE